MQDNNKQRGKVEEILKKNYYERKFNINSNKSDSNSKSSNNINNTYETKNNEIV